jgi:NhaP-type Na+/H+ or K+/H+ antiporter
MLAAYENNNTIDPDLRPYENVFITFLKCIWTFTYLSLGALAIGLSIGIISSLMTKYCRSLVHSAPLETFFLYCLMWVSYVLGDLALGSGAGVMSLITTGIFMA